MRCPALLVSALVTSLLPAPAAIIVSDSFDDGDRTNGTDPLDAGWYKNSNAETLSVADNELSLSSTVTFQGITGTMPSTVTLAAGESIELTFTFRFLTTPGNTASSFRFGLYNDNAETVTADTDPRESANSGHNSFGYYANVSTGTSASNAFYREFGGESGILSGNDRSTAVASNSTNLGLDDTDSHTASLRITATGTGVSLSGSVDGFSLGPDNANAPDGYLTFNQIAFSNNSGDAIALDDIIVTYIPEPSTGLLGGLAGFLVCFRRRK